MVWTRKEIARKQAAAENVRMGTRRNVKKGRPKERWVDEIRQSMSTNLGLAGQDTRDSHMEKLSFG
jgi:hypothetical protein